MDPDVRVLFEKWNPETSESTTTDAHPQDMDKIVATANLAQAIRAFGHLEADLDPLGSNPPGDSYLNATGHNLSEEDFTTLAAFNAPHLSHSNMLIFISSWDFLHFGM